MPCCKCITGTLSGRGRVSGTIAIPQAVHVEEYEGPYEVTPLTVQQTMQTANLLMTDDVTILQIPYFETSNVTGTTVYIAERIGD